MKQSIFRILVALVLLSLAAAPVGATGLNRGIKGDPQLVPGTIGEELTRTGKVVGELKGAVEPARYIVELEDEPVASYAGGVQGYDATRTDGKLNVLSPASLEYTAYLKDKQGGLIQKMDASFGRPVGVLFQYQYALNGFSAEMTPDEAARTAAMPGVKRVYRVEVNHLTTDTGPGFIGAGSIWEGTDLQTEGEGVIVGIIDTGINSDHPSFAEVGPLDGYVHQNPYPSYLGVCDPEHEDYDSTFVCNDKLIGAYTFTTIGTYEGFTPEDFGGHGSHTASTAAGNYAEGPNGLQISGVAPHANIIAYDVCDETPPNGACYNDASVAAVEQAIADGVDVINYSISGGANPYNDPVELAFLAATDAGIVVNTSAGNDGPDASTVAHRSPWVLSVAATTHGRLFVNVLEDMTGGGVPPQNIAGLGYTGPLALSEIVYAGDYGNPLCFLPSEGGVWADGTDFTDQIVVCDRGTSARVDKALAVALKGAAGFVLANNAASGNSLVGDMFVIPGVHIGYADGVALKTWLASGSGHMAAISGFTSFNDGGDVMADFSSRGPNTTFDVMKPDVAAPGVDILAAVNSPEPGVGDPEYNFMSGTSMASPHSTGATALLTALHPEWSPAEIRSALMLTAKYMGLYKEDGVTQTDLQDIGNGRIQVDLAAYTGFVLDETTANFTDANPATGGQLETLNLATLYESQCVGTCTFTRTLTSAADVPLDYTADVSETPAGVTVTVDPAVFTLPVGGTQVVTITVDVSTLALDEWSYGTVQFLTDGVLTSGSEVSDGHMSWAVQTSAGNLPDEVTIFAGRDAGAKMLPDLSAIEIADLTIEKVGLSALAPINFSLVQDEVRSDPYDDLNDVYYQVFSVDANMLRVVAEVTASTAPDADLYLGMDTNEDGLPQPNEELLASTSSSWNEYVSLVAPEPGDYWVIVQNWAASSAGAEDDFTLGLGLIDTSEGNFDVLGPTSVSAGELFDLEIVYNIDVPEGTVLYGAFSLGTDGANPGNLGTVAVNYLRGPDEVTKTVSSPTAKVGDTLTYEIEIAPNLAPEDVAYLLSDTLPAGVEYVAGSLAVEGSGTAAEYDPGTRTITWEGTLPGVDAPVYVMSTNAPGENPEDDPLCTTPYGEYLNLEDYDITPAAVSGDTKAWTFTFDFPTDFYGTAYDAMYLTDDGMAVFDADSWVNSEEPWENQSLPDATLPNGLIAFLWDDLQVNYSADLNKGISFASDAGGALTIVEYDDVSLWGAPAQSYDVEVFLWDTVSDVAGEYEIMYAYDNVVGPLDKSTIGVENMDATHGAQVLYNGTGVTLEDGLFVCLDSTFIALPVRITYDVVVVGDPGAVVVNEVEHDNDRSNTVVEFSTATFEIARSFFLPFIGR